MLGQAAILLLAARAATACSPLYSQCGGLYWTGEQCCSTGRCRYKNPYYSQCLLKSSRKPTPSPTRHPTTKACAALNARCGGGSDYNGTTCCQEGLVCSQQTASLSQCTTTSSPSSAPTHRPTRQPSTHYPSCQPTASTSTSKPTAQPSQRVTALPTQRATAPPSYKPTAHPTRKATPCTLPAPPQTSQPGFQITLFSNVGCTPYDAYFRKAAALWESVITGDLPDYAKNPSGGTWFRNLAFGSYSGFVDDVIISYLIGAVDGAGSNVTGNAVANSKWTNYRQGSGSVTALAGVMTLDETDVAFLESTGQLQAVVSHEMGHVLGIGSLWNTVGCSNCDPQNPESSDFDYLCNGAQSQFNTLGFSGTLPLESVGDAGTICSHWAEATLGNELMTGYISATGKLNPLSAITVGSLQDLGYQVNISAADPFSPALAVETAVARAALTASAEYVRGSGKPFRMKGGNWCERKGTCFGGS